MNRLKFLKTALVGLVSLPILLKGGQNEIKTEQKFGHIFIGLPGVRPGDWQVLIDGHFRSDFLIQGANDIEGWYDYYPSNDPREYSIDPVTGRYAKLRGYGKIDLIYRGNDSRFTRGKSK